MKSDQGVLLLLIQGPKSRNKIKIILNQHKAQRNSIFICFPSLIFVHMSVHVFVHLAGYYTHISTLADVQENVMEYLHVLSRPMVINHDHDIIWTEAYMDSVVSWLLFLFTVFPEDTEDLKTQLQSWNHLESSHLSVYCLWC